MSTGGGNPASPAAGHGVFRSSGAGGFAYGVGVSIGILLLLDIIAFAAFYFCCAHARRRRRQDETEAESCCPVCLESYGDGQLVRELPECGHVSHRGCVDHWLRRRATCPVCRTSPLPSPLPTPLTVARPSS